MQAPLIHRILKYQYIKIEKVDIKVFTYGVKLI